MTRKKITVVGAGNVGATTAQIAAGRNLGDIVLLDIVKGLAEGKALDISQAGGVYAFEGRVTGTMDWQAAADSDIVIITSGMPRKPGMSRDDLVAKNTEIVKSVSRNIAHYCPDAFVIVVCNPLDAMVYTAAKVTGFTPSRVMGMAGALDAARYAYFIADELGVGTADVRAVLMGGHGDDMVPLPRYTSVAGIPLLEWIDREALDRIVDRTRKGGIEIVNLLGYSAYYAPAAGAVRMAEAILRDSKAVMSCCAWCDAEYGIDGAFVGVPVVLGAGGVERVIELDLNDQEKSALAESASHVRELVAQVEIILADS
ncbi:MAG: malate dehydrogenase [Sedimentisphaerales bacterium]|nr:malate dehydrogenase [Sedimentisphaerales bacterium]